MPLPARCFPWLALLALPCAALAAARREPAPNPSPATANLPKEIASAFFIAKSENRNQVHFAVAVDERCAPRGEEPVSPRWRMLERRPEATEPLGSWEQGAYGVAAQRVLARAANGGAVELSLQALPGRQLVITTSARRDGSCGATVAAQIGGASALLESVWVELGFLHIAWIELRGHTREGLAVNERISP